MAFKTSHKFPTVEELIKQAHNVTLKSVPISLEGSHTYAIRARISHGYS